MEKEDITAVTPLNPIVLNGGKRETEGFEYNKDAGQMRCPAGYLSLRKARTGKKNQQQNQSLTHYFDIKKCQICLLREGGYKPGSKSKTYSITIKSEIHQKRLITKRQMNLKKRQNNTIKLKRRTQN